MSSKFFLQLLFLPGFLLFACQMDDPSEKTTAPTHKRFELESGFSLQYPVEMDSMKITTYQDSNHFSYKAYWFLGNTISFFVFPEYPNHQLFFHGITIDKELEILAQPDTSLVSDKNNLFNLHYKCESMDGSYFREYIQNERLIVGIMYTDTIQRNKILEEFDRFVQSIQY